MALRMTEDEYTAMMRVRSFRIVGGIRDAECEPDDNTPKKSKYGNTKVEIDGFKFASKKEGMRYVELKHMQRAGIISGLELQVPYVFEHNDVKIAKYLADFVYQQDGKTVVEDVKGMRTQIYIIKRKLMLAFYGVTVKET